MSSNLNTVLATPFGDDSDPRGFWLLLLEHVEHLQVRNFAADTIRIRANYVRAFALWCLERDLTQPANVTKPILESYQRYLYRYRKENDQPLSWRSQNLHLAQVNQFFRYLVKYNHLPFNPASELELPKQPKSLPKAILSPDEVERILAEPDATTTLGLRDRAILEVFYSSGIRRAELCRLRLEHIDVDRQTIFIKDGKGQKDRYVPVGLRALLWIARYVENARDKLLLDQKEPTLFLTRDGKPLNPDSLTEYARKYIQSSGIEKSGACHIFRHTMATLMHENGADIRYIQAILGHERLETTQIYTRTSLRKLLEVHGQTHPAERPDDDSAPETESNQ
ncbi:site-specific tyrosine recombinase XerC [Stieleria sp. TO1_6]|uniref:site-specific tyrosine recombinase XerC n=1 Tax=Stieleria tagensis TaxID=2956795 RepID=UPI00209B8749|nr:site-specific tyrosine recombinase XerC [Stieleria tagensis]MCO8124100.1 site-specific tyrosine recombinase XerC [Stieleria tagensis]